VSTGPDVLLLLTDQERYDVTAPDGPDVETPNIDRLADDGMTFTRAYTPISICTSARGSLLSGQYPHNHGMLNNCHEPDAIRANFPEEIPTFGELLSEAGYATTYVGKWHVGRDQTPGDFGFRYLGDGDGAHETRDAAFEQYRSDLGVEPADAEVRDPITVDYEDDPLLIAGETTLPPEATLTYYLAEQTIERIEAASGNVDGADDPADDRPIFHRTDFPGPHHPYLVPEPYASMYDPDDIDRWESYAETFDGKPAVHEQYLHYRGVADLDWETWSEAVAKYFGFVTFIDDQIGRILDAVDEHLDVENTIVVHSTDHGDFAGSHRQFNKGPLMYEDTYRIPLQVRWPGVVEAGSRTDDLVRLHDLMPTFLEICGAPVPDGLDARAAKSGWPSLAAYLP
jgi:arylsulfatase A-like enzyme